MDLKLPSYPRPVMTRILNLPPPPPPPPHPIYVRGDERLLAKHRLVKKNEMYDYSTKEKELSMRI